MELAPSLTIGAIVGMHMRSAAIGAIFTVVALVVAGAFERGHYPIHLMPLVRIVSRLAVPLVGLLAAWTLSLAFEPVPVSALVPALLGGWLVLVIVLAVRRRVHRTEAIRVAVVGGPLLAGSFAAELVLANLASYRVIGWVDLGETAGSGGRRLGPVDDLERIMQEHRIELVVYGVRESGAELKGVRSIDVLEAVAVPCLRQGVPLIGANQLFEELFGQVPVATMNAAWFQYVLHPSFSHSDLLTRIRDLLVGFAVGVFAIPVVLVAALAIKLEDRGPVFYRQQRVGEGGRLFEIVKLRTMRTDAEGDGRPIWAAAKGDGRTTRVGAFLRRTHVDELPQLWNVMRGEMALVGPRPERPEFVRELELEIPYYDRRELMRPGVTGWAQVRVGYAGSETGAAWKLAHDLYYLKRRGLIFDLMICAETFVTPGRDARIATGSPDELFVFSSERI